MNWQTLFNPFFKFSEKTLLAIGILASILLIIACYFTDTKMDSLLHFSPAKDLSFNSIALYTIISLIYAIVLLFIGHGQCYKLKFMLLSECIRFYFNVSCIIQEGLNGAESVYIMIA